MTIKIIKNTNLSEGEKDIGENVQKKLTLLWYANFELGNNNYMNALRPCHCKVIPRICIAHPFCHSPSTKCLETAQSLANMLLLGNSCRHVTSKVHARSWLPLQRLNILSDAWSKLLNIWVLRVTKTKIPRDRYF